MATIPTPPTFASNDHSLANLQALSASVAFLIDCDIRPLWHLYKTATASITSGSWTKVSFGTVAYDDDGVSNASAAVIVTQGYYAVEACVDFLTGASAIQMLGSFLFTAGSSNPHFTLGNTVRFCQRGGESNNTAGVDSALCLSDICPMVLYPGDTIEVDVWVGTTTTLNVNANGSYSSGRYVSNFTGYFVRTGT